MKTQKRISILIISVITILISMTLLTSCKNDIKADKLQHKKSIFKTDPIVGTWKHVNPVDEKQVYIFSFEEKDGKIIATKVSYLYADDFHVVYNKDKKCYQVRENKTKFSFYDIKIVDNETVEITEHNLQGSPTKIYTRVK